MAKKHFDMNERHLAILRQLDQNERMLCKNYPEGRERTRACFERDDIRELKELIAIGMVLRAKNPVYNERKKYHIPNSVKMSKFGYGLTEFGREAYERISEQLKAETDD